jgi:hypothetical protein
MNTNIDFRPYQRTNPPGCLIINTKFFLPKLVDLAVKKLVNSQKPKYITDPFVHHTLRYEFKSVSVPTDKTTASGSMGDTYSEDGFNTTTCWYLIWQTDQ